MFVVCLLFICVFTCLGLTELLLVLVLVGLMFVIVALSVRDFCNFWLRWLLWFKFAELLVLLAILVLFGLVFSLNLVFVCSGDYLWVCWLCYLFVVIVCWLICCCDLSFTALINCYLWLLAV